MKAFPAVRAARGGLSGRKVQALVIGAVVLVSTAASTLALGMLVDSSSPFDHAFAAQHGAEVTATMTGATARELDATTHLTGVTAAAGPFTETTVTISTKLNLKGPGPRHGPRNGPAPQGGGSGSGGSITVTRQLSLVGRSSPDGPVDDLTLTSGHWATGPGQVVWNSQGQLALDVGQQITVAGTNQRLTVVGVANSITNTAQAWATPAEISLLTSNNSKAGPVADQMLYRFASAGSSAQVNNDIGEVRAALPARDLVGAESYLSAKLAAASSIAPWVPFIVAFGVIGLVMSVLIVVNVVSGAVVAGTQRIGVLKSIGFSPAQVVAAYVLQVAVPALTGCLIGVVAGNALAVPMLSKQAQVYGVGSLTVPPWVDVAVLLTMLGLSALAAVALAMRAGRMSAVQAIATGRAPRPRHGYLAHRVLGRLHRLPRPVTIGLASPFARPNRTAITLAAVLAGGIAVTFAIGLGTSLNMVYSSLNHSAAEPVQVILPGVSSAQGGAIRITKGSDSTPIAAQEKTVQAALDAQSGTAHYAAEADDVVSALGLPNQLSLIAFTGDASWTGYAMIDGHWYSGQGQVDVNTAFLTETGTAVGDSYTLTSGDKHITVTIAGEVFDPQGSSPEMFGAQATLGPVDPKLVPGQYDVAVKPGTNAAGYVNSLSGVLGQKYPVFANTAGSSQYVIIIGMITTMTLLLAAVAGLGVLNTVVLQTRERVHDLGVFKAVGMTPRQTIAMVVCSVAGVGLLAGLIALPIGIALHNYILPVMGNAAQTGVPPAFINVYHPAELVLLALAGLAIAVAGALPPAGWAAKTRTASALRTE